MKLKRRKKYAVGAVVSQLISQLIGIGDTIAEPIRSSAEEVNPITGGYVDYDKAWKTAVAGAALDPIKAFSDPDATTLEKISGLLGFGAANQKKIYARKQDRMMQEAWEARHPNTIGQSRNPYYMAGGGQMPYYEYAELEDGEVFKTPNGLLQEVKGKTHAQGGEVYNLPEGTAILGNRMSKKYREQFKEIGQRLKSMQDKHKKTMNSSSPMIAKTTSKMMLDKIQNEFDNLVAEQEMNKFAKGGVVSASKAKQMLRDGMAHGRPLTDKQKRYFGWIAGKSKYPDGGYLSTMPNYTYPREFYSGLKKSLPVAGTVSDEAAMNVVSGLFNKHNINSPDLSIINKEFKSIYPEEKNFVFRSGPVGGSTVANYEYGRIPAVVTGVNKVDPRVAGKPGYVVTKNDGSSQFYDDMSQIPKEDRATGDMKIKGYKKGGIHIKPENRGKFTAYKKRTGKTTEEALHSKNPHVRQMANFVRNARKWKHADGDYIYDPYAAFKNPTTSTLQTDLLYTPKANIAGLETAITDRQVNRDAYVKNKIYNTVDTISSFAPIAYNIAQGMRKEPRFNYQDYVNPYIADIRGAMRNRRYDINPELEANRLTQAAYNYNLRRSGMSPSQLQGGLQAGAVNKMRANASAYATRNNMNNQYLSDQAQIDYYLGRDISGLKTQGYDINLRNRAARRNFMATAASQLQQLGQTNRLERNQIYRDAQKMGLLNDLLADFTFTDKGWIFNQNGKPMTNDQVMNYLTGGR